MVSSRSSLGHLDVPFTPGVVQPPPIPAAILAQQPSSADRPSPALSEFCNLYFRKKVSIDTDLGTTGPQYTTTTVSSTNCFGACVRPLVSRFNATRRALVNIGQGNTKLNRRQRILQGLFEAFAVVGIVAAVVSVVMSTTVVDNSCNVVVPNAQNDCCSCVCSVNESWCVTRPTTFENFTTPSGTVVVPLEEYGNYFSGTNRVHVTSKFRRSVVAVAFIASLVFALVELFAARLRGNWYMLICVLVVLTFLSLRSVYLHRTEGEWSNSNLTQPQVTFRTFVDVLTVGSCALMGVLLPFVRPGFLTTQFQQFGALTIKQESLRNYSVMYATTLLDWQTSTLFYAQALMLCINNSGVASSIATLYLCDLLSTYLGYQYVRFEKYRHTVVALTSKALLCATWFALAFYITTCFDSFKARALYLRYLLFQSQYLGVDVASAEAYLLGDCGITPAVSGSGDVTMLVVTLVLATIARGINTFYAALLTLDFDSGVVASLFFDVVAAKQKEGVAVPTDNVDTIYIDKNR